MKFFCLPAKFAISGSRLCGLRASTETRYDLPAWLGPNTPALLRRAADAASLRERFSARRVGFRERMLFVRNGPCAAREPHHPCARFTARLTQRLRALQQIGLCFSH